MAGSIGVALGAVDGLAEALRANLEAEATLDGFRAAVRRYSALSERIVLRVGEVAVAPVAMSSEVQASCNLDEAKIGILFPFVSDAEPLSETAPGFASLIETVYALFRVRTYGTISVEGAKWTFTGVEGVPLDAPEIAGDDAASGLPLWAFLVVASYTRQRT